MVTTQDLVDQFVNELLRFYELPIDIVGDRDTNFTSDFGRKYLRNLKL